jgi:hypothetical protein
MLCMYVRCRRLAWNKQDPNYLATIMVDSSKTMVLDIRVPSVPVSNSSIAVYAAVLLSLVPLLHVAVEAQLA